MAAVTTFATRDELSRRLANGAYRTLIDAILDGTGRILQKLARRSRPVSFVYSAAAICLSALICGAVISVLLGEYQSIGYPISSIGTLGVMLAFASLVIFKLAVRQVLASLRDNVLGAIVTEADLVDVQQWLAWLCNIKVHLAFSLIYGLVLGIYTAAALSVIHLGGPFVVTCLVAFIWGMPMYLLLVFLDLPIRLSRYDYRLYKADPSSSEVIAHLESLLKGLVYLYAVVAAGSMAFLAAAGIMASMTVISIVVAWLPISILFVAGQSALGRIITRAKWQTLTEIQDQIRQIEASAKEADQETMERMTRLMDYHDRVKETRNSVLDFRAALSFINSLLLPVLGFLLGNLDLLQRIFVPFVKGP